MNLTRRLCVPDQGRFKIKDIDPDSTPGIAGKAAGERILERNLRRIDELQFDLHAESRRSLLIVFQALDAGGKDGVIRRLATGLNPQGCQVQSFKATTVDDFPSTGGLREYAETSSRPFAEFVAALSDDRLQARIELPFFEKVPTFTVSVGEALMQAMTHSQWHRGQNATRLRELGGEPPAVDLIIWYLKDRPPAAW